MADHGSNFLLAGDSIEKCRTDILVAHPDQIAGNCECYFHLSQISIWNRPDYIALD